MVVSNAQRSERSADVYRYRERERERGSSVCFICDCDVSTESASGFVGSKNGGDVRKQNGGVRVAVIRCGNNRKYGFG